MRVHARHAKPSRLRNVALTTGLAAAMTVPLMAQPASAHPGPDGTSPVSQPVAAESRLTYADGAGSETFNGLRPHAAWSARVIKNKFGIGTVYGKGARPNNPSSDHPRGLAADFVTSRSQGDRVRDFVIANWRQLNVKYIIWEGRISTDRGRTWRPASGHYDHVHVSFLDTPVDFTYQGRSQRT